MTTLATNNPARAKLWLFEGKKIKKVNNVYFIVG